MIHRVTVTASLRELEGKPCCPRCGGKGYVQKLSGPLVCSDCSGTGDPAVEPTPDPDFEAYIDRITKLDWKA